ncbi:hypothetical protein F5Y11DRAFT_280646 [Daldinia sp. FL1419]|nr:hypothetical protein F5Y11DRAFT_280646 [Daldinia sp. FL1419]
MKFQVVLFGPALLAGPTLALRGPHPPADLASSSSTSLTLAAPPAGISSTSGVAPIPIPSGSQGIGPKCGKGYTYCGYMLTENGHNFAPNDISKAYCNGLSELCTNGKPKTDVSQAVFVCMNEQPSSVELLCACSSKCRNDAESNFIAHCDKPCINA